MLSLRNFHEFSPFMCVCLCVMLELKRVQFGVRFLVDEGSRHGARCFMQILMVIVMMV